ncbi:hypothetical protein [Virgibacillus salexigens]|uniref:hypothetical protein n=1 Tax=Virgibacillus salexigens TaxID=61016 RepID=UPI00190A3426|nr:hypothetical protein [Virgibacillus salexigens]
MDALSNLIEAIFSNIFIIFVIIAGIIGFLRDGWNKYSEKESSPNRPNRTPRPMRDNSNRDASFPTTSQPQTSSTISVEQQHKEQMERLAGQMGANRKVDQSESYNKETAFNDLTRNVEKELTEQQIRLKKQVSNNLTKKGLVNGVIMAEVLGKPRALKPYQNVIYERKK